MTTESYIIQAKKVSQKHRAEMVYNTTELLDRLLMGYDKKLRPGFGGKLSNVTLLETPLTSTLEPVMLARVIMMYCFVCEKKNSGTQCWYTGCDVVEISSVLERTTLK